MVSASFMANLNSNPFTLSSDIWISRHYLSSSLGQTKLWSLIISSRKSAIAFSNAPGFEPVISETSSCLAQDWREIQGSKNWENLLKPLNPLLRDEIIRYGELVKACYKAFDFNPKSKRYLNCKYGKKSILREVGLEDSGYEVTKYIYATADINIPMKNDECCARWVGYVAVSNDDAVRRLGRRDLLVTFRGTATCPEWIANFMSCLTPARLDPINPRPEVKVGLGFLNLYTSEDSNRCFGLGSCREQHLSEVSRLVKKYEGEELSITIAGHSMGSALALLLAYDLAELGFNEIPLTVYSFAGPRVGNSSFKERCEELGIKVLRVVNVNDPITKLPGILFNENSRVWGDTYELPWSCCYAHVGVELAIDFFQMQNPSCVHDLESYIKLLKCPMKAQVQKGGENLINRVKEWLPSIQKLNTWSWQNTTKNIMF